LDMAATEVSKFRLDRTLYAEYPNLKQSVEQLRAGDSKYNLDQLAQAWETRPEDVRRTAQQLIDVGFFTLQGDTYCVPPLYQRALNLIPRAPEGSLGRIRNQ